MKKITLALGITALIGAASSVNLAVAQEANIRDSNPVSPARGINQRPLRDQRRPPRNPDNTQRNRNNAFRSIDGSNNNREQTAMGAAHIELRRMMDADYGDGIWTLSGATRPSARAISNAVAAQSELMPNSQGASDFLWQWGQFLDHDIDLTDGADPIEPANIPVPAGDPFFDPFNTGTQSIALNRSIYNKETGVTTVRQQINEITAWIDASNVYGSDQERADALRTFAGDGKLKTSDGNLLPFNTEGLPNAGGDSDNLFLAGDVRANEQVGLAVMHTLFVREHNRLTEQLANQNPDMDGETLYQKARQLVGAQMQAITYREYLPALLGEDALSEYSGYQPDVDGSIMNSFSSAAYRYGHSALSPQLLRLDENGKTIEQGHLALRDAFFSPSRLTDEGGIEPLLRGLASQICQTIDTQVIDDVRNFLFGPPGAGGFDLAALNIQRGRDHGLPSYNDAREALGFARVQDFSEISSNLETQNRLQTAYSSVDDIDLWVGGLSEDPAANSQVGPLFQAIIVQQFEALRDGDRYWYTRTLNRQERNFVENSTLAEIIRRNTTIGNELQEDVFHVLTNSSDS